MSKLEEFLEDAGIYYRPRDNSVTIICPSCGKEKLDIHKEELNYICYYCAETTNPIRGGNVTKFLADLTGLNYGLVKRRLIGFVSLQDFANFSISKTETVIKVKEQPKVSFPETCHRLSADASKPGVEYLLRKRGIPVDVAIKHDLRYDYKKKSIVFPVYDNEILVGYQSRSIDPECPKAFQKMTLKGFEKSDYLMFENSISSDSVVLAEGPISALKFAKCGIGFVASMGKYVSDAQMARLKNKGVKKIYLALDDDAFTETEKLMLKFENDFEFYLLQLSESIKESLKEIKKPDFGDCNFEQIQLVLQQAEIFNKNTVFSIKVQRLLKE